MSPARSTKRVRFAHDVPDGPPAQPASILGSGVLVSELSDDLGPLAIGDEGPVKAKDPGIAAAQRAQQRKVLDGLADTEEASILDDVAAAEEEYEEPEELYNEAGVPIEPFHLKKEREEGYFDADGNYIEYKLDGLSDAWLDSLEGTAQTGANQARDGQGLVPVAQELDEDDVRSYKKRITDMLQSGETVLQALRRLGGTQEGHPPKRTPWKRARKQAVGQQQEKSVRSLHHSPERPVGRTVPEENRETFDKLTEWSSILLDNGDYSIYNSTQEEILATLPPAQPASQTLAPADPDQDMFSDGCYFDPDTQLYGDASSGHWYAVSEGGQYEMVS
ncbi:hypothetical protein WJX72_010947 [[Myrmecia] bisecta]|uniref:CD2 antigen cytoplasmic tail-binding protein 2 n=1 Tax=[Myrmecia] bisecta TaxID=41462 RepID=A0AAW1R938_9CHLO